MSELPDNFAGYPETMGERRCDSKGGKATALDWSPREALISVLRDIDEGKCKPDALVLVFREPTGPGTTRTYFRNSSDDFHVSLGLLEHGKYRLINGSGPD